MCCQFYMITIGKIVRIYLEIQKGDKTEIFKL